MGGARGLREREEWGKGGADEVSGSRFLGFLCHEPLVVSGVGELGGRERLSSFGVSVGRIMGGS